jgi:nitroreductase
VVVLRSIVDRHSIRRYTAEPVTDAVVESLIEAARLAPSGSNTQPWHFIVVRSEKQRRAIAEVCGRQGWMVAAPVHVVCVGDIGCRVKDYAGPPLEEDSSLPELKRVIRDTAIAAEHLVLEATAQGLGTCWVGLFAQEEIRPVLGIPDDKYVLAVIAVGYPAESPSPRPRRPRDDMVRSERW